MVNKIHIRTPIPSDQINVEPNVAMVKDLLDNNVEGQVLYYCGEAARIAKLTRNAEDKLHKNGPVVGMLVVSVKIGDHCYHLLCDTGAGISAFPFSLSLSIKK